MSFVQPQPLYIVRRCSGTGQEPEAPLSEVGLRQAEELANQLKELKIAQRYSSPYKRALQNAEPFAKINDIQINILPELRERNLGECGDEDWKSALFITFEFRDLILEGGESSNQAKYRAETAFKGALEEISGPTAVFTHGNIIALLAEIKGPEAAFNFWEQIKTPDVFIYNAKYGESLVKVENF